MNLWIMNQEETEMVMLTSIEARVDNLSYRDEDDTEPTIKTPKYFIVVNGYKTFGEYSSKERLYEIVDEIKKVLINNNNCAIYEMPKE